MAIYQLHCFGQLQLRAGETTLAHGSTIPLNLLLVLATSARARDSEWLCQQFWPGRPSARARRSLDQAVYTIRSLVPDIIVRSKYGVHVNRDLLKTDLDDIRAAIRSQDDIPLDLLTQELLPGTDFAAGSLPHYFERLRSQYTVEIVAYLQAQMATWERTADWLSITNAYDRLHSSWKRYPEVTRPYVNALIHAYPVGLSGKAFSAIKRCTACEKSAIGEMRSMVRRALSHDRKAKIPAVPVFGRSTELARMHYAITRVRMGAPVAITVTGGVGLGKSRLARQFGRIAAVQGCRVECARFSLTENHLNYARLVRAVMALTGVSQKMVPLGSARSDIMRSIAQAVRRLEIPAVLVVDDLDSADESCAELLQDLFELVHNRAFAVLITSKLPSRFQTFAPPANSFVHHLPIELTPLVGQDYDALLRWAAAKYELGEEARQRVQSLAGGNPMYVLACSKRARMLRGWSDVPDEVEPTVDSVLDRMTTTARNLAAVVALAPGRISVRVVFEAVGAPRRHARQSLEWLRQMGVITKAADGCVEAADKFVCTRLLDQLTPDDRRSLGLKLAGVLTKYSRPQAAALFEQFGSPNDAAVQYIRASTHGVRVGAYEDVVRWSLHAIALTDDCKLILRARYIHAQCLYALRRHTEAADAYLELAESGDRLPSSKAAVVRTRYIRLRALLDGTNEPIITLDEPTLRKLYRRNHDDYLSVLNDVAQTIIALKKQEAASRAMGILEAEVERSRQMHRWLDLALGFANLKLSFEGYQAAQQLIEECVMRARVMGTARDRSNALTTRGLFLLTSGQVQEAISAFTEARDLSLRHRLPEYSVLNQNMAVALMEAGDYDAAAHPINDLLTNHDKHAAPYFQAICHLNLATIAYEVGNYQDVISHAGQVVDLGDYFPRGEHGTAFALLGLLSLENGETTLARHLDEEARRNLQWGDPSYSAILHARILSADGRSDDAIAYLKQRSEEIRPWYMPAAMRTSLEAWRLNPPTGNDVAGLEAFAREATRMGMMPIASACAALLSHRQHYA